MTTSNDATLFDAALTTKQLIWNNEEKDLLKIREPITKVVPAKTAAATNPQCNANKQQENNTTGECNTNAQEQQDTTPSAILDNQIQSHCSKRINIIK